MRVAALYDIHGNLPALKAVLAEVGRESFDRVVVGGDVFWGPWPAETLRRLRALGEGVVWVRGNCDRETLAIDPDDRYAEVSRWVAERLHPDERSLIAAWPLTVHAAIVGVGTACFCHATPRSDVEIITELTPPEAVLEAIAATDAEVVVCGHTHVQFDRVEHGVRIVNAGSVGMPYEGAAGAYWARLGPGVELLRTGYDTEAAIAAIRASGYPDAEGAIEDLFTAQPTREQATAEFERQAAAMPGMN